MSKIFNLGDFRTYAGAKVFSGRPRGEEVRRQLGLTALDAAHELTIIQIPDDVYTLNMSFFLGLCAESVIAYGPEEFAKHYIFEGPEVLIKDIPEYISQAVKESIPLQSARRKST
jgi:hypothetical protein